MLASFACFVGLFYASLGDSVVQLENGKVRGTTIETPGGQTYYVWRGIPFGKPPIGELRYLNPVKAEPWEGVLDGSKDPPACFYFGWFSGDPEPVNGHSEDCLYVNVYSPVAVGTDSKVDPSLPVLFYIHGGGFFSGTGDSAFYDPTPFLEENVIVITFNYRLGTFGFLSTEDDVILGNAGLKDQLLALTWTKENIASFGGNPDDITIFGESAGAMSVGYHLVSPMSRNLFKGAIMQSGSAISNVLQSNSREYAYTLASQIDPSVTKDTPSSQVRDIVQSADAELVVNLTSAASTTLGTLSTPSPVIEVESEFSFLTRPLYETLEAGNISRVPIIIGHNSAEMIFSVSDTDAYLADAKKYDSNPELLLPTDMKLKNNTEVKTIGEQIHQQYVGEKGSFVDNAAEYVETDTRQILHFWSKVALVTKQQRQYKLRRFFVSQPPEIRKWQSDNLFVRNSHKHALLQSKFTPVYMYHFSYYGSLSKGHPVIPGAGKVGHAEELGYLFNISTKPILTDEDYLTRKRLLKLWTNFAKTSNPTPEDDSTELLQNVKWEPISEDNIHYLDIDDNLQMKPSAKVEKARFWDYLWDTYSYRPYNTF